MIFDLWVILILFVVLLSAISAIVHKKILMHEHAMEAMSVFGFFVVLLAIPVFFFVDYSQVTPLLILFFALAAVPSAIGAFLFAKGMKHMDLGTSMTLWVAGPGIVALMAYFFLGEVLTETQIVGLVLLIIGSYILESKPDHSAIDPIKLWKGNKGVRFVLTGLVFLSGSAVLSRYLLGTLEVQLQAFVAFSLTFSGLTLTSLLFIFHDGWKGIKGGITRFGPSLFLIALITFSVSFLQGKAISLAPVGLVMAIKRLTTLVVIVIGGQIFHEHKRMKKFISALVMLSGVGLILI